MTAMSHFNPANTMSATYMQGAAVGASASSAFVPSASGSGKLAFISSSDMPRISAGKSLMSEAQLGPKSLRLNNLSVQLNGQASDDSESVAPTARRKPNLLTFETERSVALADAAGKKKASSTKGKEAEGSGPNGERPNYLKFETAESMRRAKIEEAARGDTDAPKLPSNRDLLRFKNGE